MEEKQNSKPASGPQSPRSTQQHEISFPSHSWSLEMLLRRLKALDGRREDKLTSVIDTLGEFGTFQWRLVALTFIPSMLSSFFMLSDNFMLTAQRPYCNTSWILAVGPNLSVAEQLNLTLPRAPNGSFLTCLMYIPVSWDLDSIIHFGLNYTETCKYGWIYPYADKRSLINEFDLVCGNEPKKESMQTVLLAGILTGSLLFGFLSDKMGRYPAILMSLLGLLIFGFGTAFVNTFYQFLLFRFAVALAAVGYAISSVSLVMEWLVGEHRAYAIVLEHCFMAVGVLFLSGSAYKISHWRLLFLLGGMPMFPVISNIWVLRESPRWLMVKGKVEETVKVLCYAAEVNKTTIPLNLLNELQQQKKKVTKASIVDFYTNQHLFKVILSMACVWFTISYIYFTLSLKMKDFGVDIYFQQAIPGILEVPARLCCLVLLEHLGRKCSLFLSLILAAIMCLFLLFLPQELKSTIVLVLVLGEFILAATVAVFLVYTAELLPTILRSTGLGMVCLAWTGGAITALAIFNQIKTQLPIFFCCLSCVVALCFSSLVPETGNKPLHDGIEYNTRESIDFKRRSQDIAAMIIAGESMSDVVIDEVTKNTILNAMPLQSEVDMFFSTASEKPSTSEVPSPAP
ncbi:solute carrier family 22 member 14 [Peromyscus maniculatus bairdii]|uniref:solute carrier family 22 member 14 n=1 Tax=Peromyscus maniculatus bairdii TaxID=230844 RepID=UPI00042AC10D|nr:solute carrier family 22 member 14 [Peromyscus maniculatus bairdii]XP_042137972.1 solute carrier family 22 member 14 [Peromyscus maniculatus bairdii]XP_042137973.1 solute carrier family 22 member 14 [Peromyscus maniculatus bairdii]XP_042137974.1 solute carrier family 22 member 14 [Peromyscus maniculatus bairdii]XP_042137975.1 solute carrier family 22 member 14 [Peromyscus maniculatus bairdii]